ncbi:Acetyltransferase (GNAT) family protein [Clostridium cavendishii DSM 21758]|uniref:Acetyltransferase (GNAT) family protein n=1 Tax=Clostridium cavendishii DSM 21758 TaxID=1121302 RepID=A0A1M6CDU6_9CLOT|nr:GNAT family N-acetyltransferase [Clostridium cavendishii]SHI59230.1 Acetyltransferase (GNAT) family protein [Clostridium cavendishii DSM 21758]
MEVKIIHNKEEVKKYLEDKNISNFMYHCSNIEKDFWEYSQFYGLYEGDKVIAMAIFIIKYGEPILLATSYCKEDKYQEILLEKLIVFLPSNLYSHLNIGSYKLLKNVNHVNSRCSFYNMKLNEDKFNFDNASENIVRINYEDKDKLIELFESSHPEYMLEEKYLKEGFFYGIWDKDKLISVAGVFSNSEEMGVMQIGNVTTHYEYRNKGLAKQVITKLIMDNKRKNRKFVLNVKKDNLGAINVYKKLGFEIIGEFEEVITE